MVLVWLLVWLLASSRPPDCSSRYHYECLGVLWVYIYTLALQDKITPPLPNLVKRPTGSWCACTGGDSCLGCPPSPKRLKITDVMSLEVEKVLKVLSSVRLLLYSTCLFSLMRSSVPITRRRQTRIETTCLSYLTSLCPAGTGPCCSTPVCCLMAVR